MRSERWGLNQLYPLSVFVRSLTVAARFFSNRLIVLVVLFAVVASRPSTTVCAAAPDSRGHGGPADVDIGELPTPVQRALRLIARKAPTIHAALIHDDLLRAHLADPAYAKVWDQLARLCASKDRQCQDALRVIGDAVPRLKSPVGTIRLDGRPDEWQQAIPSPVGRRWHEPTEDRAQQIWAYGAAGVVRDNRLYLLAGVADPAVISDEHFRLIITLDCCDGPEWDATLNMERTDGQWRGWCDFIARPGASRRDSVPLNVLNVASGPVIELGVGIDSFAPAGAAKPVWTLYMKARTNEQGTEYFPRTHVVPIFDESAPAGVFATPYVRNLVNLAADVGLEPDDRIACAVAIAAATIDATSDEQVRLQLRRDNAALVQFAREIAAKQRALKSNYRLDQYPLEAQVAWANRCIWLGATYLSWNRTRDRLNDLENYNWAYTSVDTLRALRGIAESEHVITPDAQETARRAHIWVSARLKQRPWLGHVERDLRNEKNDPSRIAWLEQMRDHLQALRASGKVTVGHFEGEPVYQVFARNSGVYLRLIRKNGCFWGGCPDEAWIEQDLLRAAGLAPLALSVYASRGDQTGHCWAAYYRPVTGRWHSAQDGRSGDVWWWFQADRVAVYPFAAMATRVRDEGPLPYPWFLKRELQGKQIMPLMRDGIPTQDIRRWMFTPCW